MPIGNDDKGVWLECVKEYGTGKAILDLKNGFVRTLLSWNRPPSFVLCTRGLMTKDLDRCVEEHKTTRGF